MLSGEIVNFIEAIDYDSKPGLLDKLRKMRQNTIYLSPPDRHIVKQMIGVSIQQVFHSPEEKLLLYKKGGDRREK